MIARTKGGILEDVLNEMSDVAEKQKHKEIIKYVVNLLYEDEIKPLQEELIALEDRSCSNCKFNSNIYPRNEIVSCDKHRRFLNQHEYKYCGCYERK